MVLPEELDQDVAGPPCVIHLVRYVNGLSTFSEFAASLRRNPAGMEHELVLAMKGFPSASEAKPYLDEVQDLAPKIMFFPDRGMDLGVYFAAAAHLRRARYCFLNSHSRPLVEGWLAKLNAALDLEGVGVVGATGSWASMHSWLTYAMGLPSPYRSLMPSPEVTREQIQAMELERVDGAERRSPATYLRGILTSLRRMPEELLDFDPFPTAYLRPNSFMISHATLKALTLFVVRNKMDTYVLESGRANITWQVEKLGLSALVVDRYGDVYRPSEWQRSRTLWQGDQEGLLIADNQTRVYKHGGPDRRQVLSVFAWGLHADPTSP